MAEKTINRWLVVIAGMLIIMCLGVAYAWGVFLMPIATDFGWTRSATSISISVLLLTFSIFMAIGGALEKKYTPRTIATLGGCFVGLGWILAYFTHSLWWLYITYGLLSGIGTGLAYLPALSTGVKWFPEKKGMISGLVIFGFGFGAAFLAPLATHFITLYGWRTTMLIYGISFGVIIIIAARFLHAPPSSNKEGTSSTDLTQQDFPPKIMLKTPVFKLIITTYFAAMVAGMVTIGHIAAFIEDMGYTQMQAALALTIIAITNGFGRLIFGALSDKVGRQKTLVLLFLLIGIMMFALSLLNALFMCYIIIAIIGLCFGGFLAVYPALTADFFGAKYFGANYGLIFIGYGVGCFIGPWLGGMLYDLTQNYSSAFIISGLLALCGGLFVLMRLNKPTPLTQSTNT